LAYTDIYLKIEPLMKKCEEANKNLVDLRANLKKCNDEVSQLEREAELLKNNFNKKTNDLQKYKKELGDIEIKK
jgi:predicted  nucleic acid-binding Zn-ribbon protein